MAQESALTLSTQQSTGHRAGSRPAKRWGLGTVRQPIVSPGHGDRRVACWGRSRVGAGLVRWVLPAALHLRAAGGADGEVQRAGTAGADPRAAGHSRPAAWGTGAAAGERRARRWREALRREAGKGGGARDGDFLSLPHRGGAGKG